VSLGLSCTFRHRRSAQLPGQNECLVWSASIGYCRHTAHCRHRRSFGSMNMATAVNGRGVLRWQLSAFPPVTKACAIMAAQRTSLWSVDCCFSSATEGCRLYHRIGDPRERESKGRMVPSSRPSCMWLQKGGWSWALTR